MPNRANSFMFSKYAAFYHDDMIQFLLCLEDYIFLIKASNRNHFSCPTYSLSYCSRFYQFMVIHIWLVFHSSLIYQNLKQYFIKLLWEYFLKLYCIEMINQFLAVYMNKRLLLLEIILLESFRYPFFSFTHKYVIFNWCINYTRLKTPQL